MREIHLLYRALGPYRRYAVFDALAIIAETVLELFIPFLMSSVIDKGISTGDVSFIMQRGSLMLACALGALTLGLVHAHCIARFANGLGAGLRQAEYERIQEFSFGNLDRFRASSLVTRLTTDITVVQNAVTNGFRPMIRGPLMLVLGLVYAATINTQLVLVFAITLPVLAVVLGIIVSRTAPRYRELQQSMDHVNAVVQEDLLGIRAVKAYVREEYECRAFDGVNDELTATSTRTFGSAVLNQPVFQIVMYATAVMVLWFGGRMILAGTLMVGELTGFMSYVHQIMNSLMMISNVFLQITRALTSIGRCCEVLEETPDLSSPSANPAVQVQDGSVEFRDVSFKYQIQADENVLDRVSFCIPSGKTFGLLGTTGSGKSSLVQLIPRLYDATEGSVLVGGMDVRSYDLAALRDAVGVVLQKNVLFSGTVRDNLLWGNEDASDEELLRVCRLACVDEFLDRIGGLDGNVGQEGAGVSGGQRQRLCIARALLKRPKVLILDDSTSALDMATEARLRENLMSLPSMTLIIIAQRIASVRDADIIAVLDDGHIEAMGSHDELLLESAIYQELFSSQNTSVEMPVHTEIERGDVAHG